MFKKVCSKKHQPFRAAQGDDGSTQSNQTLAPTVTAATGAADRAETLPSVSLMWRSTDATGVLEGLVVHGYFNLFEWVCSGGLWIDIYIYTCIWLCFNEDFIEHHKIWSKWCEKHKNDASERAPKDFCSHKPRIVKRNKPMIAEVFSCCNDEVPWVPFKVCWFKVKTWTAKLIMTCQILLKKHNAALIDTIDVIDVPLFAGFVKHVFRHPKWYRMLPHQKQKSDYCDNLRFCFVSKYPATFTFQAQCWRCLMDFPLFTLARKFVTNYMKCFLSEFTKLHQIWSTSKLIPPQ